MDFSIIDRIGGSGAAEDNGARSVHHHGQQAPAKAKVTFPTAAVIVSRAGVAFISIHQTVLVKDIFAGTGGGSDPSGLTEFNGAHYFSATDGGSPAELWKTDGTAAGTVLVVAIINATGKDATPAFFNVFNGALYFTARDGVNGYEFWKTDGTAAGTQLLKDICPGPCDGPKSNSGLG